MLNPCEEVVRPVIAGVKAAAGRRVGVHVVGNAGDAPAAVLRQRALSALTSNQLHQISRESCGNGITNSMSLNDSVLNGNDMLF